MTRSWHCSICGRLTSDITPLGGPGTIICQSCHSTEPHRAEAMHERSTTNRPPVNRPMTKVQPTSEAAARSYAIACIKALMTRSRYTADDFRKELGMGYGGPEQVGFWISHGKIEICQPWDGTSPPKYWRFSTDVLVKESTAPKPPPPEQLALTL